MDRQLTMVITYVDSLILICGKHKIYSNKAVKYLTRLTQHVPRNKANISLCYLLASYKWKDFGTTLQHMWSTCVLIVCSFHLSVNPVGCWRAGAYTKRNMLTEVDHIGHKLAKYCLLKLAGSVMKYWLYFMACVGWSELDVWLLY